MSDAHLERIQQLASDEEKLGALAALAEADDDPVLAIRAKAREIGAARRLQRQQHAVVAGAELIGLVEAHGGPLPRLRDVVQGFVGAAMAAMDLPEVPLSVVDALVEMTEQVLDGMGCAPYAAWQLAARRHAIAGDAAAVQDCVARLAPHVSRSNHIAQLWECPGCVLVFLARCAEEPDPAVLEEILSPILTDGPIPWLEDPRLLEAVHQVYGTKPCCGPSRSDAHVLLALALVRAGRTAEARIHWARSRRFDEGSPVWSQLAALELALADGEAAAQAEALAPILDRLPGHEDAYEAVELGLTAAQAQARAGDPRLGEVLAQLRANAARLDARLEASRHLVRVEALIAARGCQTRG
jgi:hypothetical protein